jgi:hypothetical protein
MPLGIASNVDASSAGIRRRCVRSCCSVAVIRTLPVHKKARSAFRSVLRLRCSDTVDAAAAAAAATARYACAVTLTNRLIGIVVVAKAGRRLTIADRPLAGRPI